MNPDAQIILALSDTDPAKAIKLARQLPDGGSDFLTKAAVFVDAGTSLQDADTVKEGIRLYRKAHDQIPENLEIKYNLANGLNNLALIKGYENENFLTFNQLRKEAKKLYEEVGESNERPELAVQALTNLGNILFASSRYVEAYFSYKKG